MARLSFGGIFLSIFILAVPSLASAEVEKTIVEPPDSLTDIQKTEYQIGTYSGWLRLCGYGSKSSQISRFMKISPHFRKGEIKMSNFDAGVGCNSSNKALNEILGQKDQWVQYLDATYSP